MYAVNSSNMVAAILNATLKKPLRRLSLVRNFAAPASAAIKDCTSITPPYAKLLKNLEKVQKSLGNRPLTLAEKVLYSHLTEPGEVVPVRGETYLRLSPDRVAMQDASAQMALLQFMLSGLPTTAIPSSIHCDHLIEAHKGAELDVRSSLVTNQEIFDFLESAARKYGIAFWRPGSGIIHQIVLENYAAPGSLMLGTDSHTPNAGGLGMIAIGVGGADAVDAMANIPWELKAPRITGVRLTGALNGWASPKDVILRVAGELTVRGGTGHIIEYFGDGVKTLSATGMATICNMGAEIGATTSIFPHTASAARYLHVTGRGPVADAAARNVAFLCADKGAEYDRVVEINLTELEPHINGPFTPDLATPLSKFKQVIKEKGWKDEISAGLIGSCTNSSYQDMSRAASIARQASSAGLKTNAPFFVTPGSEQIRATIERDGQTAALENVGGKVLANACGPCIGQWKRSEHKGEENAILTSFNRNFKGRNDGNNKTMNFLASPEIVTAMSFAGRLSFNPITDTIPLPSGQAFKFNPPTGEDLPPAGFSTGDASYLPPSSLPQPDSTVNIAISPTSTRLQILQPFTPWDGSELRARVLVRVVGKCTTDHISAAGPWLKYKGHLENISENTLIGAVNAETGATNSTRDFVTGEDLTIPEAAKRYLARQIPWIYVADHNLGEGSAREHAALQVRYLGCTVILARSFARIHETNLKKVGILPLTFAEEKDWELFGAGDEVETVNMVALAPGKEVIVRVRKEGGDWKTVRCHHSLNETSIEYFKAGGALNVVAKDASKTTP